MMGAIYKRELCSYFRTMTAWIYIAVMCCLTALLTMYLNFYGKNTNFSGILPSLISVCAVSVPLLTMQSFASERAQKTDKLIYVLPLSLGDAVCGKFFAALTVTSVPCAVMCVYPLILSRFGEVSFLHEYSCILAYFFICAVFTAIGIFVSTLCEQPISAAFISVAALLALCISPRIVKLIPESRTVSLILFFILCATLGVIFAKLCRNFYVGAFGAAVCFIIVLAAYALSPSLFDSGFAKFMDALSVYSRFDEFIIGVFSIKTLIYYATLTALFLFFGTQSLEKHRS